MRRSLLILLTVVAALAVPATAAAKPRVVIVTTPGFWPVCSVVTGSKVVMYDGLKVGAMYNKTLACFGRKGRFEDVQHIKVHPIALRGTIKRIRHWRKGFIPGTGHSQIVTISGVFWTIRVNGVTHTILSRVTMYITAGHKGHPKPTAVYGNAHRVVG